MRRYIGYAVLGFCLTALFIGVAVAVTETYQASGAGEYSSTDAPASEAGSGGGIYEGFTHGYAAHAEAEREIDYAQIIEDTDIMAKIIDKSLDKIWPRKYEPSTLFRQSIGCQGIYLKGYGAVFMTNINFPVAEREVEEQEEPPADDLWQQTRSELGRTPRTGTVVYTTPGTGEYDAKRVGMLKEELLRLIGEYGANIRQLGEGDSVLIVVRGTPVSVLMSPTTGYNEYRKLESPAAEPLNVRPRRGRKQEVLEAMKENIGETSGRDGDIIYEIAEPSEVTIQIEDPKGKIIRKLKQKEQEPGEKAFHWDGKDDEGKGMGVGIYNYTVQTDDSRATGKIMLAKSPKSRARRRQVVGGLVLGDSFETNKADPAVVLGDSYGTDKSDPATEATGVEDMNISTAEVWTVIDAVDAGTGKSEPTEVWIKRNKVEPTEFWIKRNEAKPGTWIAETNKNYEAVNNVTTQLLRTQTTWSGMSTSRRTTMIVKVSKKNVMEYKDGSLDFEDFASQADVIQY